MHMNRRRRLRAPLVPALIGCLALFVVGSNYCLLSAWGGNAGMACLVLPGTASAAAKAPQCSHCAPATNPAHTRNAPAKPSCCPAPLVAPSAPSIQNEGADPAPSAMACLVAASVPSPLSTSAWHGRLLLPDGQPPTRLARAPLSARAPPLA
jgi:hypothetical protein